MPFVPFKKGEGFKKKTDGKKSKPSFGKTKGLDTAPSKFVTKKHGVK